VAGLSELELEASLAQLVQAEFLYEKALYPEAEYAFKHPLTHEVALESQLAERRARVHAAVARSIEEVDTAHLDERAALLAYHWEGAGDAPMAAHWHARAARWCALDNAAEAQRHWSRVQTLLRKGPESPETTALLLEAAIETLHFGLRLGMREEEARAVLREGRELASTEDVASHITLLHGYASIVGNGIGRPAAMREAVEEAIDLAEKSGDPKLRFFVREGMIDFLHFTGHLPEAVRFCDSTIEFGHAHFEPGAFVRGIPVSWTFGHRAWIEILMGRLEAAAQSLRTCEAGTRGPEYAEVQSWTECVWVVHRLWVGDGPSALSHARRALDAAEKFGSNLSRVWAYEQLGVALGLAGDWDAAVHQLELALATVRETRSWLTTEAELLAHLAEARLGAGDAQSAQSAAEEAIETGRHRQTPVWEAQAHLAHARVLLARADSRSWHSIESAFRNCICLVEQTGARVYEPHVHEVAAALARLRGDEAGRERELREAHRLFTEMGATGHAERVGREPGL
jgi:tetratricopeptide (TPR) repeat protein